MFREQTKKKSQNYRKIFLLSPFIGQALPSPIIFLNFFFFLLV